MRCGVDRVVVPRGSACGLAPAAATISICTGSDTHQSAKSCASSGCSEAAVTARPAPPRIAPRPPGGGPSARGRVGDESERERDVVAVAAREPLQRRRRLPSNDSAGASAATPASRASAASTAGSSSGGSSGAPACAHSVARLQSACAGCSGSATRPGGRERARGPPPSRPAAAQGRDARRPPGRRRRRPAPTAGRRTCRGVARSDASRVGHVERPGSPPRPPRRCADGRSRRGRTDPQARPPADRRSSPASGTPSPRARAGRPPRTPPSARGSAGDPSPARAVRSARPSQENHGRKGGGPADAHHRRSHPRAPGSRL